MGAAMIAEGIRTRQTVIDAMLAHARAALPEECCGLLLDCDGVIDEAIAATNVRHSPTRFEIDPRDHVAAIRKARATARTVRAAYHSHPAGPPGPSATDAAEMGDPSLLYFIVSLQDPAAVHAFRWEGGNFSAVPIVPVP